MGRIQNLVCVTVAKKFDSIRGRRASPPIESKWNRSNPRCHDSLRFPFSPSLLTAADQVGNWELSTLGLKNQWKTKYQEGRGSDIAACWPWSKKRRREKESQTKTVQISPSMNPGAKRRACKKTT